MVTKQPPQRAALILCARPAQLCCSGACRQSTGCGDAFLLGVAAVAAPVLPPDQTLCKSVVIFGKSSRGCPAQGRDDTAFDNAQSRHIFITA